MIFLSSHRRFIMEVACVFITFLKPGNFWTLLPHQFLVLKHRCTSILTRLCPAGRKCKGSDVTKWDKHCSTFWSLFLIEPKTFLFHTYSCTLNWVIFPMRKDNSVLPGPVLHTLDTISLYSKASIHMASNWNTLYHCGFSDSVEVERRMGEWFK